MKWWVATVLPRALRFKRPLHRCNACNPCRNAKAELNHRRQACEVLTGTGVRVAKVSPSALNPAPGHYFDRARSLPAGRIHLGNWSSIRVARPVFRFGRPACISQHLCSLESRAGIAPAFAALQAAAGADRPTGWKLKRGRKLSLPPALLTYRRCIQRGTSAPSLFAKAVARK